jgi:hypothetical protein
LHTSVSIVHSEHGFPLHDGGGLVHDRNRFRTPEPHSAEHGDHCDQGVDSPLIGQHWILHGCISRKLSCVQSSLEFVIY